MEIFSQEKRHSEILVWEIFSRPPKLGARSPPTSSRQNVHAEKVYLVMYKISLRYFMLKYFLKYFRNVYVFNELFQNAICTPCLFLPHGAMAQNLVMYGC